MLCLREENLKKKKEYSTAICLYSNTEKVGEKTIFWLVAIYTTPLEVTHRFECSVLEMWT